jgi:hypothetical protein
MNTMYSAGQQSNGARSGPARELARLLFHWLVACAGIVLICSFFFLTQIFPGEAVPFLISAFAMLGIGVASFCLWALAVGMPTVRSTFYGPLPMWLRRRSQKVPAPWFDDNGRMLWQRDDHGGWVRKVDVASEMVSAAGQEPFSGQ